VRVLAGFAAVAVLLAGVGIHGLLAFLVASRSREIWRPARPRCPTRDIVRLVLRHGLAARRARHRCGSGSPTWRAAASRRCSRV
jgi:hypothetical protein